MFWVIYYLLRIGYLVILGSVAAIFGLLWLNSLASQPMNYGWSLEEVLIKNLPLVLGAGGLVMLAIGSVAYVLFKPVWYFIKSLGLEFVAGKHQSSLENLRAHLAAGHVAKPFALYLRSFANERTHLLLGAASFPFNPFDLELHEAIALGLPGNVRLVGLRGVDGRRLRGMVEFATTHEEWREAVNLLWSAAKFVVIVPGETPGVLEEVLAATRDGARADKVIFVMPPRAGNRLNEAIWNVTVLRARDLGIRLPAYQRSGLLFDLKGREVAWGPPFELGGWIWEFSKGVGVRGQVND